MIVGVLAIIVVINLIVDQIPWKADLTQNQLYSLSDQTMKLLAGLKSDVSITTMTKIGQEDPMVRDILAKYALASGRLKIGTMDPERNPGWAKQYDTGGSLSEGSIVVAAGKRFKTIDHYSMYNVDYSNPNQQPQVTSISVEQHMTAAILYVTAESNPTIYILQGHGEDTLASYALTDAVGNQNYVTKDLNLLSIQAVPVEAEAVLVLAPKVDISAQDAEKIRSYLTKGGRAYFLLNPPSESVSYTNLDGLLKSYGIAMQKLIVVEGDQNRVGGPYPTWILPNQETHDILSPLKQQDLPMLVPASEGIETLGLRKQTLKIEPLLTTSQNSWGKVSYLTATTPDKEKGDAEGPFTIAVAITDPSADPNAKDAKLVVVGSSSFLRQEITSQVPGNTDFFLNGLSWLREKKDTISIQPKSLMTLRLQISQLQSLIYSGIVVIVIPLLVLGSGFVVWMRRRHL